MNPWSTPARIRQTHLANQNDDLARNRRSPLRVAAFPSPVQSESSPVPSNHSFGFNDHQCGSPVAPETREPNPQESIRGPQTEASVATGSLENRELMPQGKILGLQRCRGPKSLPNQGKEQENGCEHGLTNLSRRWLKFNQVSEIRVFW